MKHRISQQFPKAGNLLQEPTQREIKSEPIFRRATADFVSRNGGDIAKLFLRNLSDAGIISDRTRLMCQRCLFVKDAFPSPPNWHVDFMPGTTNTFANHINNPVQGAIANLCSRGKVATTIFLDDGVVELDEPDDNSLLARGGEYLDAEEGRLNWCTPQVERLVQDRQIEAKSLQPNAIYYYDSTNLHKAPQYSQSDGYRLILRANTPPNNFSETIPFRDELLELPDYFFTVNGNQWKKHAAN